MKREKQINTHKRNDHNRRGAVLLALCLCLLLSLAGLAACSFSGGDEAGSANAAGSADTADGGTADTIAGVPLGTWQDSVLISERDNKAHPVQIRFTTVDTDPAEVQKQIDEYNVSAAGHSIPALNDEQYDYIIAHYEVKFPEDYPDGDYGITQVVPTFTICAADGTNVISVNNTNYSGLTQTFEIGYQPRGYDFHAGDTYKGAIVYIMVDGYKGYRIVEHMPASDGSETLTYYMPE